MSSRDESKSHVPSDTSGQACNDKSLGSTIRKDGNRDGDINGTKAKDSGGKNIYSSLGKHKHTVSRRRREVTIEMTLGVYSRKRPDYDVGYREAGQEAGQEASESSGQALVDRNKDKTTYNGLPSSFAKSTSRRNPNISRKSGKGSTAKTESKLLSVPKSDIEVDVVDKIANHSEDFNSKVLEEHQNLKGLKVELMAHQAIGYYFLLSRERIQDPLKGGFLLDDMGLGKTIQMLALILGNPKPKEEEQNNPKPSLLKASLIVCPLALIDQWYSEIKQKTENLKVVKFADIANKTNKSALLNADVVLITYDLLSSRFNKRDSFLYDHHWWRVILDESHIIRNRKTKKFVAVYSLHTLRRWCVTGTPIQNNLNDLAAQLEFLRVSQYSTSEGWKIHVLDRVEDEDLASVFTHLRKELSRVSIRRKKQEIQLSSDFKLPVKTIHSRYIEFFKFERELYSALTRDFSLGAEGQWHEENELRYFRLDPQKRPFGAKFGKSGKSLLSFLIRLRQICCDWSLVYNLREMNHDDSADFQDTKSFVASPDDTEQLIDELENLNFSEENSPQHYEKLIQKIQDEEDEIDSATNFPRKYRPRKLVETLEILSSDRDRKTIIFSQFNQVLYSLQKSLNSEGYVTEFYSSALSSEERTQLIKQFKTSDFTILLCSVKCASVGLNLTTASRVIIYEPLWNPAVTEQAIDRVYRIGQSNDVDVYELISKNTVEERIVELQKWKKKLENSAIATKGVEIPLHEDKLSERMIDKLLGLNKFVNDRK